jgi:hypothetical protein
LKISQRAYSSRRQQLTGNSQIPDDCGAMVAISGAPSKAKYASAGAAATLTENPIEVHHEML